MPLEVLHLALMLLRPGARTEGAQVAALASLRINFARVQTELAAAEPADHGSAVITPQAMRSPELPEGWVL